jgi:hypothetical protein
MSTTCRKFAQILKAKRDTNARISSNALDVAGVK